MAMAVPLRRAGAEARARAVHAAALDTGRPQTMPISTRWMAAAAACIGGLAALVLGWGAYVQNEVDDVRSANAGLRAEATEQSQRFATVSTQLIQVDRNAQAAVDTNDAVLEIMAQDDVQRLQLHGTTSAPGATGRYVWSRDGGLGSLVALDMPDLPEGHAFCLWTVYENAWVFGGLFYTDEDGAGHVVVQHGDATGDGDRGSFVGFAVTIEREASPEDIRHDGPTVLNGQVD
jgi:hypothetical protein